MNRRVTGEYIHRVGTGSPVIAHAHFMIFLEVDRFSLSPLMQYVFVKLSAPRAMTLTAFSPKGDKFRHLLANKCLVDIVLSNGGQGFAGGLPIGSDGGRAHGNRGRLLKIRGRLLWRNRCWMGLWLACWSLIAHFVDGKNQSLALAEGCRLQQQYAFGSQALANTLNVVFIPEGEGHVERLTSQLIPVITLIDRRLQWAAQFVQNAEHGGFFQADGGG